MRLSHEIIVLDYGDEQTSPFDNPEKTSSENKRDRNDNGTCFAFKNLDSLLTLGILYTIIVIH